MFLLEQTLEQMTAKSQAQLEIIYEIAVELRDKDYSTWWCPEQNTCVCVCVLGERGVSFLS